MFRYEIHQKIKIDLEMIKKTTFSLENKLLNHD